MNKNLVQKKKIRKAKPEELKLLSKEQDSVLNFYV